MRFRPRFLALLALGACATAGAAAGAGAAEPSREALIHAAVIGARTPVRDGWQVWVQRGTISPLHGIRGAAAAERTRQPAALADTALWLRLLEAGAVPGQVGPLPPTSRAVRWVGTDWLDVLARERWGGRERMPRQDSVVVISLSRPAFSDDGARALLYYETFCGGLCGGAPSCCSPWTGTGAGPLPGTIRSGFREPSGLPAA